MVSNGNVKINVSIFAFVLFFVPGSCGLECMINGNPKVIHASEDDKIRSTGKNFDVDGNDESKERQSIGMESEHDALINDGIAGRILNIRIFAEKRKHLPPSKKDEVGGTPVNSVSREITGEEMAELYKRWLNYQPQTEINKNEDNQDQYVGNEVINDEVRPLDRWLDQAAQGFRSCLAFAIFFIFGYY